MIKFIVLPREMLDISKPENIPNYAKFLSECNELSVQLSIQNIQEKNATIVAEPATPADYEMVISFIEKYFSIQSVDIDRTENEVSYRTNGAPVFKDSKLNQQFDLLAKAIQKCIDNNISANGYLLSAIQAIDARVERNAPINFSQFDIVDFNFGTNMPYEISGGHIWSIVLKKENDESFIVPLVKNPENPENLLQITENDILIDATINLQATYVSVKYARWVSNLRANKIVGKVTPDFIKIVQTYLSTEYNFAVNDSQAEGMVYEKALLEITSSAIEETISKSFSSSEEKIRFFLEEINYPFDDEITQSFLIGITLERKLTFNTITLNVYPSDSVISTRVVELKRKLKESFNNWATNNCPNLKSSLPGISFIQLIKLMKKYL